MNTHSIEVRKYRITENEFTDDPPLIFAKDYEDAETLYEWVDAFLNCNPEYMISKLRFCDRLLRLEFTPASMKKYVLSIGEDKVNSLMADIASVAETLPYPISWELFMEWYKCGYGASLEDTIFKNGTSLTALLEDCDSSFVDEYASMWEMADDMGGGTKNAEQLLDEMQDTHHVIKYNGRIYVFQA